MLKNPKGPPFSFFRHCENFFRKKFPKGSPFQRDAVFELKEMDGWMFWFITSRESLAHVVVGVSLQSEADALGEEAAERLTPCALQLDLYPPVVGKTRFPVSAKTVHYSSYHIMLCHVSAAKQGWLF